MVRVIIRVWMMHTIRDNRVRVRVRVRIRVRVRVGINWG